MKKIHSKIGGLVFLLLTMMISTCLAEGEKMQKPELKLSEVCLLAAKQAEFHIKKNNEKYEDFIVKSIEYCSYSEIDKEFKDKNVTSKMKKNEWGWIITYVYYKSNDISYVYLITQNKDVVLLEETD